MAIEEDQDEMLSDITFFDDSLEEYEESCLRLIFDEKGFLVFEYLIVTRNEIWIIEENLLQQTFMSAKKNMNVISDLLLKQKRTQNSKEDS
jgi:hypothetical protein